MSVTTYTPWEAITPCDTDTPDPAHVDALRHLGQGLLWSLSGRRYGEALTEDEAYRVPAAGDRCVMPWHDESGWHNRMSPPSTCRIPLTNQPVRRIEAVRVAGVALDPSSYRLDGNTLELVDGQWTVVGDCEQPVIVVDYTWGRKLPHDAKLALGEFICEGLKGLNGGACRLSRRIISNARQGSTQTFESMADLVESGFIGLTISDAWIRAVNPGRQTRRSRVFSPHMPRRAG